MRSYTGHYCSLPVRTNPRIAACSMIGSGLRLFDISNPARPREVGYFNVPGPDGASAGMATRRRSTTSWRPGSSPGTGRGSGRSSPNCRGPRRR